MAAMVLIWRFMHCQHGLYNHPHADGSVTVTGLAGSEGTDTLTNIEILSFSDMDDYINTELTPGDDVFTGGASTDSIDGLGGNDIYKRFWR